MLRSSESETEILLGNKQLLGIFFLIAVLLGIAFTSGYMIGRNGTRKTSGAAVAQAGPSENANGPGGETHAVSPSDSNPADSNPVDSSASASSDTTATDSPANAAPLGSPKRRKTVEGGNDEAASFEPASSGFAPQSGQEFLQVAAVARGDANEVADVLRKKGFRAHAVPTPSNPNLYRVIVGPIRDAGDLASTRDLLRKTGFRDVIVQHYR